MFCWSNSELSLFMLNGVLPFIQNFPRYHYSFLI